jgi:lysophospholipase L1-like esterase
MSALVALGDSITYGHGGMQSGLGSQSWAQWLAEAMDLPYVRLARNGARAGDVLREQVPRLGDRRFAVGTLYAGVNDVRDVDWDAAAYERDLAAIVAAMTACCERVLVLTLPLDLGLPPAGQKVAEANAIIERQGALVADLRDFTGARWVWADHVHATAAGQVEIADRAARALGAPLPSQTVVDVPRPDAWYAFHYAKRAVRERLRAALVSLR